MSSGCEEDDSFASNIPEINFYKPNDLNGQRAAQAAGANL
jgi:hypothetical protein